MSVDVPLPRSPRGAGWLLRRSIPLPGAGVAYSWARGDLTVVSSLEVCELPDGSGEVGPQWHLSVMFKGHRAKDKMTRKALAAFGFVGERFDEDNHSPSDARHFFLCVDPARRVTCACKVTEDLVVDGDGFAWTNPKPETGEKCRGCEWERDMGKPCPIHGAGA